MIILIQYKINYNLQSFVILSKTSRIIVITEIKISWIGFVFDNIVINSHVIRDRGKID